MRRLQRLTKEEFVYTTECDEPSKKAARTTKSFAENAKKRQKEILKIMKVPTMQKNIHKCEYLFFY